MNFRLLFVFAIVNGKSSIHEELFPASFILFPLLAIFIWTSADSHDPHLGFGCSRQSFVVDQQVQVECFDELFHNNCMIRSKLIGVWFSLFFQTYEWLCDFHVYLFCWEVVYLPEKGLTNMKINSFPSDWFTATLPDLIGTLDFLWVTGQVVSIVWTLLSSRDVGVRVTR